MKSNIAISLYNHGLYNEDLTYILEVSLVKILPPKYNMLTFDHTTISHENLQYLRYLKKLKLIYLSADVMLLGDNRRPREEKFRVSLTKKGVRLVTSFLAL
jgi:hypothetical protein